MMRHMNRPVIDGGIGAFAPSVAVWADDDEDELRRRKLLLDDSPPTRAVEVGLVISH